MITDALLRALVARCTTASVAVRISVAAIATVALLPMPDARAARPGVADEPIVAACITRSAGGRGWLEKTLWGLRDQEGGWIGAEVANSDGSHDLGPLQVNSWWVPRLAAITGRPQRHIRHWLKQDACFNVEVARWIFLSGLATTGNYWKAIGVYHSPTGWRQRRYAQSVARKMHGRFGKSVFLQRKEAPNAAN